MSKYDSWERVRVHDSDELDNGTGRFTIKDKIRQQARQRMAKHGVVDEAETVDTRLRGLRQHPHHPQASAIRWYNRFTCLSAMVSLVLGIWQNELHWQSYRTVEPDTAAQGPIDVPDHDPFSREVLKCVVTANVVIVVIGIYLYYRTSLQLAKLRGIMLPQDTFFSAGYLWAWLLETFICIIHPPPFLYFEFNKPERGGLTTIYTSDDLFTVLMIPRLYLLFRVFRDFYGLNHEDCRHHGIFGGVNLDSPMLLFKNLLHEHPLLVIPVGYLLNIFLLGYAMCVFERPTDSNFLKYKNGIWVTFVTMTTVGYGDLYPDTDFGRVVAILACGLALVNMMLVIIGMEAYMSPDPKEFKAFDIIKHKDWRRQMRAQAVIVIQSFWRSVSVVNRQERTPLSFTSVYVADTKLAGLIRSFRDLRRSEPLQHDNVGIMSWQIYQLTQSITDRVLALEAGLIDEVHVEA